VSSLAKEEQQRILSKRVYDDRKLALASLLLQKHYISFSTGRKWDSIRIRRTTTGKPVFEGLHYNVSHVDGIAVLVGSNHAIGVDIVARDCSSLKFMVSDMDQLFSSNEMAVMSTSDHFPDLFLLGWAFKEAYMKCTGLPNWDNLASMEFLNIKIPTASEPCFTNAVSKVCDAGVRQSGYTETHLINESHLIAIYISHPPASDTSITQFEPISLEEIVKSLR